MINTNDLSDLQARLHKLEADIGRAKRRLERAGISDKLPALADLTRLQERHKALVQRINDTKADGTAD